MIVWAHIVATLLMRFIPRDVAHAIVGWFTPIALFFAPGFVQRAQDNMRQVLGPRATARDVRVMTARAFANYARYMVDLVRLGSLKPGEILEEVEIRGWEHVEEAQRLGKGMIFATGHIGSWDLAGATFAARGHIPNVLVETLKPARWNERVQALREHAGMRAIPIETGVRDMIAALRRNEALAILVDRPVPSEDGIEVSFFGAPTHLPRGAAALAIRTGAAILPLAYLRHPERPGYLAWVGEPILTSRDPVKPSDATVVTQSIVNWLEGVIRQHPDQWYMFRRMWSGSTPATNG